ncbi:hypothetical protein G7074_09235 [Pedobacter sp. HDW13]|uniref:XAC2610-related protein n=1 Tax=unclassified Pedobacter TaxID=2628915 RepID=UPI000F5B6018|nr:MULTISPECIES: hypothetical protein [unclassified Pedobacter]QIL39436.1 hypothetical protein G7074_09235 [Pedobacter sp. HDW13]RQO78678.1 hypothetical protein DBR40_06980 [Pedobacter sp. KBW01]
MNKLIYLFFILFNSNLFAQKVFHLVNSKDTWQYIHPFRDKSYVIAIQYELDEKGKDLGVRNSNIYFGKTGIKTDNVFWKEKIDLRLIKDNISYEDYNNDGIKDLLIFSDTGGRGGNAFYYLFLINSKNRKINKVKHFENIVNPEYNRKHKVIVSYGLSGTNHYSIYKISRDNKAYEIGKSFEDTFESDPTELDRRIKKILKNTVH